MARPATISTTRRSPSSRASAALPTSYIQRRLQIGYNRAASLIERMEEDGVISRPNHKGVREVLLPEHEQR